MGQLWAKESEKKRKIRPTMGQRKGKEKKDGANYGPKKKVSQLWAK
jgi:hypothetical protein